MAAHALRSAGITARAGSLALVLAFLAACASKPTAPVPPRESPTPATAPEPEVPLAPPAEPPPPEPPTREEAQALCRGAVVPGTWRGMSNAEQWIPGIYPYDAKTPGHLALTFDDGPLTPNTGLILDELARHGFRATFFISGRSVRGNSYQWIRRILDEGHELGNHTYRHDIHIAVTGEDDNADYVRAEYELTQIKVDLALIATSREDFNALHARVMGKLRPSSSVEHELRAFAAIERRHAAVLDERGFSLERRPHRILYSRPPGGNPFMGGWHPKVRARFAKVVNSLGLVNIFWNASSGDSDPKLAPKERYEVERLVANVLRAGRRGGILLVHDRMPPKAMALALDALAGDERIEIVPLSSLVDRKFGCSVATLATARQGTVASPPPAVANAAFPDRLEAARTAARVPSGGAAPSSATEPTAR